MGRHASAAPSPQRSGRNPELLLWGIVTALVAAVAGVLVHLPWPVVLGGAVVVLLCFAAPWWLSPAESQGPESQDRQARRRP